MVDQQEEENTECVGTHQLLQLHRLGWGEVPGPCMQDAELDRSFEYYSYI